LSKNHFSNQPIKQPLIQNCLPQSLINKPSISPDKKKKMQPNQKWKEKDKRKADYMQDNYDDSLSDIQSESDIYVQAI
tara:strand:+ start:654 stop:887 length:234 start_codon:yes stop_codon:yes gene_type:complete